ncbi:helix-turn-helix domain-containing protein [Niameybacter massiliensis]|uniref:helix-turn-helix domain-containing protein n=1 Tax=Niameybacter massiliensis TaxID=1658108 RepID=UPI0006B67006|nr:AraC family transcriptional regulator [Niameybacter massiliensis]
MNTNLFKEFNKHLCSYFFIIFIPIMALNICYQNYFLDTYKTEVIQQNNNNLNKFQVYFDHKIDLIHKVTSNLTRTPYFSDAYIKHNISSFYDILAELNAIKALDPTFVDIYYYNKNVPNTLYSCNGTYNINTYTQINPNFLNGYANFENKINSISKPIFQAPDDNILASLTPCIEYILPVHNQSAFFVFRINLSFFSDALHNIYDTENASYTYILSDTYELYKNAPPDFSLSLDNLSGTEPSNIQTTYKDHYYISSTSSPTSNLTYMSIVNEALLLAKVRTLSNKFILLNLLILLLGFIIIFVLTNKYYEPIRRLLASLHDFNFNLPKNLDALDQVAVGLDLLDRDNRRLNYEKSLLKLLSGTYKTISSFNMNPAHKDILLKYETYKIITLCPAPSYTLSNEDKQLLRQAKLAPLEGVDLYQVDYTESNMSIWIAFYQTGMDTLLKEALLNLDSTLKATLSVPLRLCISHQYTELSGMPYALLECSKLSQHTDCTLDKTLLFYEEVNLQKPVEFSYPEAELSGLQDAITSRNIEKIELFVNILVDYINSLDECNPLLLPLAYTISHVFKKAAKILNITSVTNFDNLSKTNTPFSKALFTEYILTLSKEVIGIIQLHTEPCASSSIQVIIDYINQHYCEYDLSVSFLADHFNLSISNLSHQFKATTSVNVSSYINALRIEKAKQLLCTTSMTITDIATSIGYTQPSSFIRRFKQFTNMTPGEFRAQAK